MLGVIVIYVVLFGGLWWFMMRPQKKEQKRIQAMLASMEVGDTALTTSGFYGVIIDITSRAPAREAVYKKTGLFRKKHSTPITP